MNRRDARSSHRRLLFSTRGFVSSLLCVCFFLSVGNFVLYNNKNHRPAKNDEASPAIAKNEHQETAISKSNGGSNNRPSCISSVRNVNDIQQCYPPELVRHLPKPSCSQIQNWQDVQRCLTGRFTKKASDHYQVHILGERHSGTKFLVKDIRNCFHRPLPHLDIKVQRDFKRSKHFFQPIYEGDYTQSIIVSLFRDPVEWVAAMQEKPYHSPSHIKGFETDGTANVIPLPWKDFVTKEWSTERSKFDLELMKSNRIVADAQRGDTCIERFALNEVVPCQYDAASQIIVPEQRIRGFIPIYELQRDQSGRPFQNILELRREKIVNFLLEIPLLYRLGGYLAVRYEDLVRNGTQFLLEQVAAMMGMDGLPEGCIPSSGQPERLGQRHIPKEFRDWVDEHVDRDVEKLLGYNRK